MSESIKDRLSEKIKEDQIDEVDSVEMEMEDAFDEILDEVEDNEVVITKANPLPVYGQGLYFIIMVAVLTVLAVVFGHFGPLKSGVPDAKWLRYSYIGLCAILTFLGFSLYLSAINEENMVYNLKMGNLITTGVYSKTRNPVYVGIILIATAILFFSGNTYMYVLPLIELFILFVWICPIEERMLVERFGDEYREYRKSTHVFLPTKKRD